MLGCHLLLQHRSNNFIKTFYVIEVKELNSYLRIVWKKENEGVLSNVGWTAEKKRAVEFAPCLIQCKDGLYKVRVYQRNMALKRMKSTKKRLLKDVIIT